MRRDFDLVLANEMEREAQALLVPTQPLQNGLGGEIVPPIVSASRAAQVQLVQ